MKRKPTILQQCTVGIAALCLVGVSLGCSSTLPPLQFDAAARPPGDDPYPNWPVPPQKVEEPGTQLLGNGAFELVKRERTAHGIGGAAQITLRFPTYDRDVDFKWKAAEKNKLDGWNNSPRREIAAYEVQKLFLDPADYVVPTSVAICVPLERYAQHSEPPEPSIEGTNCVMGLVSIWMKNLTIEEPFYEELRFVEDPVYAYFLSNFQILAYLAQHRDAKRSNLLVSSDPDRRQAFSVDNGTTFGAFPYNIWVKNWNKIRVPALRNDSIERLRKVRRADLDAFGVVAQLEADQGGVLRPVPAGENLNPKQGARIQDGVVQFGLTENEIDAMWQRLQRLLDKVDSGEIALF